MKDVLIREFSAPARLDGMEYWPFPGAKVVAQASVEDLTQLLRNSRRAGYIHDAAAAFSQVDETFFREASYGELYRWLRDIRGVGAWSAAFIMIRSLGRMERIPYGDPTLQRIAGHIYGGGRPLPAEQVQELADHYGDLQGYWAHYLRVMGRVVLAP